MRADAPQVQRPVLLFALLTAALASAAAFELEPGVRVLPPLTHQQLTVFPVAQTKVERDPTQYLSLAQGLKEKLVAVKEQGGGGSVNSVQVENKSDKPLLLLGGEVILGGQQDRIISTDVVVEPRARQAVAVFCVEHGRWSGRADFAQSGGIAYGKLRGIAKGAESQQQVWDGVARKTGALKAGTATGTYRELAAGATGAKVSAEYKSAIGAALVKLPEASQLVGLITSVNGKVISVDIFGTPQLFARYRDGLLEAAYIEAADAPVVADAPAPQEKDIKGFIEQAERAKEDQKVEGLSGRTFKKKGVGVVNTTVESKVPAAKPVLRSYQAQ